LRVTTALDELTRAIADRYAIEREIGAGGMATVYLARDLRHDRKVALKVLNSELGAVLGVERFLTEIRVTANLQHPNLLPLFDSGAAAGLLFYVMPFVEGESLRARLEREKQLPVDEAVRIAVALAGALDYAHRSKVIHRDLKPENILLHDGQPLIADFGIALAVANAGGTRVTQTGLSLGTPQYMSPEQATGDRVIDARTDIYSLGAVTYEMLAGEAPHTGTNAQAIIAKLMTEDVRPLTVLRRNVPPAVDAAVRHALEKLPADRFATAREFADALLGKTAVVARHVGAAAPAVHAWRRAAFACAGVALVSLTTNLWQWGSRAKPATALVRLSLSLDESSRSTGEGSGVRFAISNDGTQLVYVGGDSVDQLFVRRLDDLTSTRLAGTDGALDPQFSPDGKWIGFVADGVLRKIPVAGGAAVTVADSGRRFSWGDGDVIVVVRRSGLWRVSAAGGTLRQVTHVDSATRRPHVWPHLLPGGAAMLFNVGSPGDSSEVVAAKLGDGKVVRLGLYGMNPRYLASGHIAFARSDGTVLAAPFDAGTLRVTGPAVPVLEDVVTRGGGAMQLAASRNGTLVYFSGRKESQLVEVDRRGSSRMLLSGARGYHEPRYSPDGRRIAVVIGRPASATNEVLRDPDVWIYELSSGALTRISNDANSTHPVWTADGRRVVWESSTGSGREARPRIVSRALDAVGRAELVLEDAVLLDASPSGGFLLAAALSDTGGRLITITLDSTGRQTQQRGLEAGGVWARSARIAPDGRAYTFSRGLGGNAIASVFWRELPSPDAAPRLLVSLGREAVWGANERELYFRSGDRMVHATVAVSPEPRVVRLDTLFAFPSLPGRAQGQGPLGQYDVSRDGQRFVMVKPLSIDHPPVVVLNWFTDVRERTALAAKK
jgi:serine/threonine-protein kinase